jgi:DNA polymerase III subunit epsilon
MLESMGLPNFAVVDVETSGLDVRRHRILQLAVVTVDPDGTLIDEWDTFVKLRWPLGRVGPTHIHGISRPMLKHVPKIDAVLEELDRRIGDSMFVAHNARFDGEFLLNAAQRSRSSTSLPITLQRRLCTLRMSRRLDPERAHSHRLTDLCDHYDITLDRPHEALSDALATAALLPHLLRAHDVSDVDDLEPFLDRAGQPARSRG